MSIFRNIALAGASLLATVVTGQAADIARPPAKPIVVPAAAPPALLWDGYLSVGYGQETASTGGGTLRQYDIRDTFERNIGRNLGLQVDVLDQILSSGGTFNNPSGTAHLFLRNSSWLFGGFVQYRATNFGGPTFNETYEGVEGQFFLGPRASLYGRAAAEQLSVANATGTDFLAQARFFVAPNWKIDARAGYSSLSIGGSVNTTMFGAGTEFRFAGPFSVFAEYEHFTVSGSATGSANFWMAGAKVNFGTTTLLQRDRAGASLEPVENIFLFVR